MACESGGRADADNGVDIGLFQVEWTINGPGRDVTMFDPEANVREASRKSNRGQSFAAWDGPDPGRGERRANSGVC